MRKRFTLVDVSIVLALACVAVAGYKLSPLLQTKADLTIDPLPGCNLNQATCAAELPAGGRFELSITPRPIPLIKPLQIKAIIAGMVAEQVDIDFSGASMDMGHHRQTLVADGQGGYRGEAMLPVCVSGRMVWRATLVVARGGQKIAVPFLFEAPDEH